MRKIIFSSLLVLLLFFSAGCSVRLATLNGPDERLQSLPHRDLGEMSLRITKSKEDPNRITISDIDTSKIELAKPCWIKYQSFYFDFIDIIAVPGTLPNGKKYSVLLDTGHPGYALTNSLTVLENNLVICPLGKVDELSSYMGFCQLPSLQLGQAVIADPPCSYLQQQWEVRLLGMPVWQQKGVLLGISLLKNFSYIVFDNVERQVEFALNEVFVPDKAGQWDSYPINIQKGRLMVNMPIEGENFDLMFDSCGRSGMVAGPAFREELSLKVNSGKIRDSKFQSGFLGELPCQRTKIKRLKIANLTVNNAEVLILPKESPYSVVAKSISMKYFNKTVVVLDFKQNLMWVKK